MANQADIIAIYDNYDFSAPIEYTFDLIFSIYGVSYMVIPFTKFKPEEHDLDKILVVSYGREYLGTSARKQIHIYASDFFNKNYLKPQSMPRIPLPRYQGLPVIYSGCGKLGGWVKKSDNSIETNIDIIASSFFVVSRYEEVVINAKDQYDRFPVTASLAHKEDFLDRPIVNEYIELLWSGIHSLEPDLEKRPLWSDNKHFAVCLTHDVDHIRKYSYIPPILRIGGALLRQKKPKLAFNIVLEYLAMLLYLRKDPYDTFDYITNLEKSLGFESSFYFKTGGNSEYDSRDTIKKSRVVRLVRDLEKKGCEIGLHPSFNSYDNKELMASEKSALDRVVSNKSYGCRQHYLNWKSPGTWRIQEQLGILYDTTLSFADSIGFRCGICLPFKPFDVVENRRLNIWELPLTVMEGSLQGLNYQNLSPEEGYKEIIRHIEIVKKFSGVFVLLWHNHSLEDSESWKGWKKVYEEVMEYISRQNAFTSSGRNIISWCGIKITGKVSKRSRMPKAKVCMLCSDHPALDARVFYKEARSLQKAGYDVTLLAPLNDEGFLFDAGGNKIAASEITLYNVRIIGFSKEKRGISKTLVVSKLIRLASLMGLRIGAEICTELIGKGTSLRADVYHCHEIFSLYAGIQIKRRLEKEGRKPKLIYDVHEYTPALSPIASGVNKLYDRLSKK